MLADKAPEAVAASGTSFPSLDVSECGNLTDEALKALAASCPSLASHQSERLQKYHRRGTGSSGSELPQPGQPHRELVRYAHRRGAEQWRQVAPAWQA